MDYYSFRRAVRSLKHYKAVATLAKNPTNKMLAYKLLGKCYQELRYYNYAVQCFTKSLQFAWLLNKVVEELQCYDLIGMQYYYLGDVMKAKYYHDKMMNGKVEPDDSEVKRLGVARLKNKEEKLEKTISSYMVFKNMAEGN